MGKSTLLQNKYTIGKNCQKVIKTTTFLAKTTKHVDLNWSFTRCIDGSQIRITAPHNNKNSYINRKVYCSVLFQGICDNKQLFLAVYVGEVSSIHDNTKFRRSDIYKKLHSGENLFSMNISSWWPCIQTVSKSQSRFQK